MATWHGSIRIPHSIGTTAQERKMMREGKKKAKTLFLDKETGHVKGPALDSIIDQIKSYGNMGALQNLDADSFELQQRLSPLAAEYDNEFQAWHTALEGAEVAKATPAASSRAKKCRMRQKQRGSAEAKGHYRRLCQISEEAETFLAQLRSAHATRRMDLSYWENQVERLVRAFLVGVSMKLRCPVEADIDVEQLARNLWQEYIETYEGRMPNARFDYDFTKHLTIKATTEMNVKGE